MVWSGSRRSADAGSAAKNEFRIEEDIMSEWYEINEGECYRHIMTSVEVRVTKVRWHEGYTGLIHWATLNGAKIDALTFGVQEAQHFLEDFYFLHASPAVDV